MSDAKPSHSTDPIGLVEAAQLIFLEPQKLHFSRHGASLRLTVDGDCSYLTVTIFRAFPLSDPRRCYSIRDGTDKEIGMIADPSALGAADQTLVNQELQRRYFVPTVTRVISAKERFGTVDWKVETDRGGCYFTTRNLRENIERPARGRILLSDVDGNRYDVRDVDRLDSNSQRLLFQHM